MRSEDIDLMIGRYAEERRREKRQVAQTHFLTHAHLLCHRGELEQFLKRTRALLVYYIDSLSLFENPFRNTQVCWLLLLFQIFVFGLCMMSDDGLRGAGIIISAGTVVCGASLWQIVWSRWLDTDHLIACYREIIDLIDDLLQGAIAEVPA
jgi:uncharacterized membrane protein YccF (DUF307 family)